MARQPGGHSSCVGQVAEEAPIPLRPRQRRPGAVPFVGLLPQETATEELDREIFDLLAAQAAVALCCGSLHQRLQRGELQEREAQRGD